MQTSFLRHFSKDLDKITRQKDRTAILEIIQQVKQVASIEELSGIKKLTGFKSAFRIRCGNYRIGVFIEDETIQFARIAHRKTIYKIFP